MEQDIGNRRHLAGAPMIDLPYDWDISPTLPNFCYRIKYWKKWNKFGLWGGLVPTESNVSEI